VKGDFMNALLSVYCYFKSLFSAEEGQDLIEYALIVGLLALAAVVAMTALGGSISDMWTAVSTAVGDAAKP
jgi:pilus assembly protein Flp/PilA